MTRRPAELAAHPFRHKPTGFFSQADEFWKRHSSECFVAGAQAATQVGNQCEVLDGYGGKRFEQYIYLAFARQGFASVTEAKTEVNLGLKRCEWSGNRPKLPEGALSSVKRRPRRVRRVNPGPTG